MKKILFLVAAVVIAAAVYTSCKKQETSTATVTFDANGGSFTLCDNKSCIDTTVDIGSVVNKPSTPSRLGYTFLGWCSDSSLKTEYDFATPVDKNLYLFAEWQQEGETEKYNTNGDSEYLY